MSDSKLVQTAIRFFLWLQAGFIILSAISFFMLMHRIRHFDYGELEVKEEKILETVARATKEFLLDYQTNVVDKVDSASTNDTVTISRMPGCVYGGLRGNAARIDGFDYVAGDYIDIDGKLFLIIYCDFEKQRLYCQNRQGDFKILLLGEMNAHPKDNIFSVTGARDSRRLAGDDRALGSLEDSL